MTSKPLCVICGQGHDSAPHRFGSDDYVRHDFEPTVGEGVARRAVWFLVIATLAIMAASLFGWCGGYL
jgi:hypothetical protein